jgi:26S proteasome non-ATPase regulatory subunit 9
MTDFVESQQSDSMLETLKQSLNSLNVQRQSLEQEAAAITSELTSVDPANPTVPPPGIDTPLVDSEGYPRNDIDVYRVRSLRGRLAHIRTDHTNIMTEIERKLRQVAVLQNADKLRQEEQELEARRRPKPKPKFDTVTGKWVVPNWDGTISGAGRENGDGKRHFETLQQEQKEEEIMSNNRNNETRIHSVQNPDSMLTAFARVESVALDSPAHQAGLKVHDEILALGELTLGSNPFLKLPDYVRSIAAANEIMQVYVRRHTTVVEQTQDEREASSQLLFLQLQPRPWNGRGLLGCHIVPV